MEQQYNAGIYVRLSRDDERSGESLSIENQKLILTDYVLEKGWKLVDAYADDGYSGTNFERPEFQRMIDDAKLGRINLIIVKDLSRFGRNYVTIGQYIDELFPVINCRFIAVNDCVDTMQSDNDIMPFKNVFNEFYSRDISKKVKSAKIASAKQGNFLGCYAPYGYWRDPNDRHKLVIDEEATVIVRKVFQMRADGLSLCKIASKMNEEHIIPPRDYYYKKIGKPNPRRMFHNWTDGGVKHILENEVYIGHMVQFKTGSISYKNKKQIAKPKETWVRCENTHEPIIDMKTWDSVMATWQEKKAKQRSTQGGYVPYFTGILKCADCGANMHFKPDMNKRKDGTSPNHPAYTCGAYKTGGPSACSSHWIQELHILKLLQDDLQQFASQIEYDENKVVAELLKNKNKANEHEKLALADRKFQIQNRLDELQKNAEQAI